jgi:hypothetical protein
MSEISSASESTNPFTDGTIPEDADFSPAGTDDAVASRGPDDVPGSAEDGDAAAARAGGGNPDALIEGNRVATASDME